MYYFGGSSTNRGLMSKDSLNCSVYEILKNSEKSLALSVRHLKIFSLQQSHQYILSFEKPEQIITHHFCVDGPIDESTYHFSSPGHPASVTPTADLVEQQNQKVFFLQQTYYHI